MSALMVDEVYVPHARLHVVSDAALAPASVRGVPCEAGVPIVGHPSGSLRLTDRGIAVVLTAFVGLFVTAVAVLVTAFVGVSNAPISGQAAAPGAVAMSESGR